ncbi:SGNH/GDSL hydrolase family protein [Planctomicrobium sp. SH661]|uniref:SGNH/GDSL hydrolase family protein n=1 Tax=Planctomicrobium sp. SH661 TaxID=3448124 RepID=UPI003F5CB789
MSFNRLLLLAAFVHVTLFTTIPVHAEHDGKVQVLLLGDSTTEGSIPRASKPAGPHLERVIEQLVAAEGGLPPLHVINTGLSGDTIHRLMTSGRYDTVASKLPGVDYVFIRYGINDLTRREDFPKNFPEDYHGLIARLRKDHPNAKIVPMTIIPYLNPDASKVVNDIVFQVATEEQLPVFDIYPPYAEALKIQGPNALNYRRYPVNQVPEKYLPMLKPYIQGERVVAMDNELDGILGHLPGWYDDRHPNLAGYNVIAVETAKYLVDDLRKNAGDSNASPAAQ